MVDDVFNLRSFQPKPHLAENVALPAPLGEAGGAVLLHAPLVHGVQAAVVAVDDDALLWLVGVKITGRNAGLSLVAAHRLVHGGEGVALGNDHGDLQQLVRVHIEASHLAVNLQQNS